MSKEEAPGTSSSCYSSSNSSSVENIIQNIGSSSGTNSSTLENGDLSVFTFLMSKSISPDLSHLPEEIASCAHVPNCQCQKGGVSPSLGMDPFGITPHALRHKHNHRFPEQCRCDCTFGKLCKNSMFGDSYSSLLSQSNFDGYLIRSLEKGVLYPIIHWSKGSDNLTHLDGDFSNNGVVINQGVYKELKRVIPPDAWVHKSETPSPGLPPKRPTWLILGYKSLDKTLDPVLEVTWKEWTGARHIYLNLRHDFEIRQISFYNRIHPQDNLDLFMYLVCMEVGNVDDRNVMWLLDFIQRTRVERMKGFFTVYAEVDHHLYTSISDEYLKYFGTEMTKSKSSEVLPDVGSNQDLSGKKFIEKLLQEIQETPLVDYC